MATQKAEKTKRADGPVKVSYIDTDGKEHDRVPLSVKTLKVTQRSDGKTKMFDLGKIGQPVIMQMAAQSAAKRIDISSRNAVKAKPDASVITVADDLFANLVAGKFTIRGEGKGGQGRTFDFDMWDVIYHRAYDVKRKSNTKLPAWSDKQSNLLRAKLESMEPKARNKYLTSAQADDPVLKLERMNYVAQGLKEAAKTQKGDDTFADLF